jgi:hypothetical protein
MESVYQSRTMAIYAINKLGITSASLKPFVMLWIIYVLGTTAKSASAIFYSQLLLKLLVLFL